MRGLRLGCLMLSFVLLGALAAPASSFAKPQRESAPRDADFGAVVKRLPQKKGSELVPMVLRLGNTRRWNATTVRACASVAPRRARVASVGGTGSIRFEHRSACWIVAKIKPRRTISLRFGIRLRGKAGKGLPRVGVQVSGGNSNPVAIRDALLRLPPNRHRGRGRGRGGARISAAPCTAPRNLGVVFVTDDSGSMAISDPTHLRARAVAVGLDQLPDGSLAAQTSFDEFSRELFGVTTVDANSRPGMKEAATNLFDYGLTDYDVAFQGSKETLAKMTGADKKAVIFLSDGAPTTSLEFSGDDEIAASGTPIYTIGLGVGGSPEAEAILGHIAAGSGAQYYRADSAGQMQPIFARIIASLTCGATGLSESFKLPPGQSRSIPFAVEPDDGEFRALAAWSNGKITVTARRPDATTMAGGSLNTGEALIGEPTYALLTAKNPQVGGWQLIVTADQGNIEDVDVSIDVFKKGIPDPPPPPPAEGRRLDPCPESFPGPIKSKQEKAFGGSRTVFDRNSSLYLVCGGWGAPDGVQLTPAMQCAMIGGTATVFGLPIANLTNQACNVAEIARELRSGDWLGAAGGAACSYFGEMFAERAAIIVAGAAFETGPGAVAIGVITYRALSSGVGLVCAGGLSGGLQQLGVNLESEHQTDIAVDVVHENKCIARRTGPLGTIFWSATSCP